MTHSNIIFEKDLHSNVRAYYYSMLCVIYEEEEIVEGGYGSEYEYGDTQKDKEKNKNKDKDKYRDGCKYESDYLCAYGFEKKKLIERKFKNLLYSKEIVMDQFDIPVLR